MSSYIPSSSSSTMQQSTNRVENQQHQAQQPAQTTNGSHSPSTIFGVSKQFFHVRLNSFMNLISLKIMFGIHFVLIVLALLLLNWTPYIFLYYNTFTLVLLLYAEHMTRENASPILLVMVVNVFAFLLDIICLATHASDEQVFSDSGTDPVMVRNHRYFVISLTLLAMNSGQRICDTVVLWYQWRQVKQRLKEEAEIAERYIVDNQTAFKRLLSVTSRCEHIAMQQLAMHPHQSPIASNISNSNNQQCIKPNQSHHTNHHYPNRCLSSSAVMNTGGNVHYANENNTEDYDDGVYEV